MKISTLRKIQSDTISAKQRFKKRDETNERIEIHSKEYLTRHSVLCYNTEYFSDNDKESDERQDYSS